MMVWDAKKQAGHVVDFGVVSAAALDPADYPLAEGKGGDLCGWPAVLEERNILGYSSIAVPGQPEGMRLALETFGTRSWQQSLGRSGQRRGGKEGCRSCTSWWLSES